MVSFLVSIPGVRNAASSLRELKKDSPSSAPLKWQYHPKGMPTYTVQIDISQAYASRRGGNGSTSCLGVTCGRAHREWRVPVTIRYLAVAKEHNTQGTLTRRLWGLKGPR
jgi:hypothetical protein